MKKITVFKDESVADVIDHVLGESDDEITLVIPKESALAHSVRNFHLLKREADAAGKTIAIESVDETTLAFAKESELEGGHPLWRGVRGAGGMSDIIPAAGEEERPAPRKRGKKKTESVKLVVHEEGAPMSQEEEAEEEAQTFEEEGGRFFRRRSAPEMAEEEPRRPSRKFVWWGAGAVVLILIALGVVTWSLGHVVITINFQKTPWSYEGSVIAGKSITTSTVNTTVMSIPAAVFSLPKNMTQLFPASGSANISTKAQGTITVYNAYSSAKQDLVATTRFVTPDGKLFRLVSAVTVPGAQVTNGQIVPSSIDARVVADQPGPAYNVGAVDKLTIPGFQGSPKYNAFYGQLKNGASGGFVGTKAVPTTANITDAKAKVTAALQAALLSNLTTSYPSNLKILDGASSVQVTKLTVNTSTDASGNFSVFGEATLQAIGFDESALKVYLLSLAQAEEPGSTFSAFAPPNYSGVRTDFAKGTVSFSLSAQGTLEPMFDVDSFKASVVGKSINDARTAIAAIPGLADGKISAWPMWLWSIPSNPNKIQMTAN